MGKSGIYIKPKNRGKFTASAKKAGRSVQQHARAVLSNPNATPLQKKRANFARNAAKWKHEDGGLLPIIYGLPEYGFGSWLKENVSGLLKGAGAIANFLPPPISTIAGPVLNVAGSVVNNKQQKLFAEEQSQAEADAQAKLLEEKTALEEEAQQMSDLETKRQGVKQRSSQYQTYGSSIALEKGGQIGDGIMGKQPQIVDYSKGDLHQEGVGGIPVDAKGNPSTVSRQTAVALTEKGEVAWNGYVFSNKIKVK